jgi:hypothetical protein
MRKCLCEYGTLTVAYPTRDVFRFLHETVHKIFVNIVLYQNPSTGYACLARGNERCESGAIHCVLHVRIIKDQYRRLISVEHETQICAKNMSEL